MKLADYLKNHSTNLPNWFNLFLLRINILKEYIYGYEYFKFKKSIETMNPEKRLIEVVNFAIKHVPYYRKRYCGITINNIHDFRTKIRFIDKAEVMEHWEEFCVDGIDWSKCITGTTGGTSGKPLKLVLPKNRYIQTSVFAHKNIRAYGWDFNTCAVIRNHKLPLNRIYTINPFLKEVIFDAFRMNAAYANEVYKTIKKLKISYLYAYPSAAHQFLKYCHHQHLDLSFLKLCLFSSEAVTPEQRFFIEKELKIPIYSMYGHSEKLVRAGSYPNCSHYHIDETYGYFELIDNSMNLIEQENIDGEIVGTTFNNLYFPLIRYRTGDYTYYSKKSSCDKNGRSIGPISGHWDKTLIYRSDGSTTSLTALNLHSSIYERIDGLQYIQEEKGKLIVCIIPNHLYTHTDEKNLLLHFQNAMGKDIVEIRYVDKLIFNKNGKFEPLISKLLL